jgi:hypothetical protein
MNSYPLAVSPPILKGDKCHGTTRKNTPCRRRADLDDIYCSQHANMNKYERPESCSICTEDLPSNTRPTKCGHYMHEKCLKTWLKNNSTCPMCREQLKLKKQPYIKLELSPEQQVGIQELLQAFQTLIEQCRQQDILQE